MGYPTFQAICGACGEERGWAQLPGAESVTLICDSCGRDASHPKDDPNLRSPLAGRVSTGTVILVVGTPLLLAAAVVLAPIDVWLKLQWGVLISLLGIPLGVSVALWLGDLADRYAPRNREAIRCIHCAGNLLWARELRERVISCPACGERAYEISASTRR